MVDLDELDEADVDWLHGMIVAHVDATDSAVGQRILADWENELKNFTKVMPRDFKKVLRAIAEAQASGMTGSDVDTAIMAAANA
jgi:glutamate synthase (NADPH/NADH) large chain